MRRFVILSLLTAALLLAGTQYPVRYGRAFYIWAGDSAGSAPPADSSCLSRYRILYLIDSLGGGGGSYDDSLNAHDGRESDSLHRYYFEAAHGDTVWVQGLFSTHVEGLALGTTQAPMSLGVMDETYWFIDSLGGLELAKIHGVAPSVKVRLDTVGLTLSSASDTMAVGWAQLRSTGFIRALDSVVSGHFSGVSARLVSPLGLAFQLSDSFLVVGTSIVDVRGHGFGSVCLGGDGHVAPGKYAAVLAGKDNTAAGGNSAVIAGELGVVTGWKSVLFPLTGSGPDTMADSNTVQVNGHLRVRFGDATIDSALFADSAGFTALSATRIHGTTDSALGAARVQGIDTTDQWPQAAYATTAGTTGNANTLQTKDTTFTWPLADSVNKLPDAITGKTIALDSQPYVMLAMDTTEWPVVGDSWRTVNWNRTTVARGFTVTAGKGIIIPASGVYSITANHPGPDNSAVFGIVGCRMRVNSDTVIARVVSNISFEMQNWHNEHGQSLTTTRLLAAGDTLWLDVLGSAADGSASKTFDGSGANGTVDFDYLYDQATERPWWIQVYKLP